MSIEAVHDAPAPPDHAHTHSPAHAHAHPHAAIDAHRQDTGAGLPQVLGEAAPSSPLWWSAPHRLGCAAALAGGLWLVILWAVR